jgi:hypothetical protein
MIFLGIPALIVYVFGIPAFALTVLYNRRFRLGTPMVRSMIGFLYNGYKIYDPKHPKERTAFFWEIVVILRKIGVVFVSVFLKQ